MADTQKSHNLLRNAAIAISMIPLFENIDNSLGKEWNKETFDETDRAINKFIGDLERLGYAITPVASPEEVFQRTGDALEGIYTGPRPSGPVQ